MKLSEIRKFVRDGIAEDITQLNEKDLHERMEPIFVSHGENGMNGALLRGTETGKLYAILARNSLLFLLV